MAGFQASRMDAAQRACMAQLLAHPPEAQTAQAICRLAAAVAGRHAGVPREVRRIAAPCGVRPHIQLAAPRPKRSTGLAEAHPADVLRHLGRRYGFDVYIAGRRVWLDSRRFDNLLAGGNTRVRRNLQEVLQHLSRAGYTVYRRRAPLAAPQRA
jgi:hypothetical protein